MDLSRQCSWLLPLLSMFLVAAPVLRSPVPDPWRTRKRKDKEDKARQKKEHKQTNERAAIEAAVGSSQEDDLGLAANLSFVGQDEEKSPKGPNSKNTEQ